MRAPGVGLVWDATGPVAAGRELLELARGCGMDSFLLFDHLISAFPRQAWDGEFTYLASAVDSPDQCLDFATIAGSFAAAARGVQLIIGVTDPNRRHPAVLAQTALTLAQLTDRAPVLGLGGGALENLKPFGVPHDHRTSRVEEAVRIIRMLFDSEGPHTVAGEYFHLDQAVMGLRAPAGRAPKLWIGANGPRMRALAGRYADGWLPAELAEPDEYARRLDEVRSAAAEAGRDPLAVTASGGIPIIVAETDEQARRQLQVPAIRFAALHASAASWRRLGADHPFGPTYPGLSDLLPHTLTRAQVRNALQLVPDDVAAAQAVVGSRQVVLEQIRGLIDAGLESPMLIPLSPVASPDAARFTAETLPWLTQELNDYLSKTRIRAEGGVMR